MEALSWLPPHWLGGVQDSAGERWIGSLLDPEPDPSSLAREDVEAHRQGDGSGCLGCLTGREEDEGEQDDERRPSFGGWQRLGTPIHPARYSIPAAGAIATRGRTTSKPS